MAPVDLLIERKAPVELWLLAEALLQRFHDRGGRVLEVPEGQGLEVRIESTVAQVSSSAGRFVVKRDGREDELPWFLPSATAAGSSASSAVRIGLAGGDDERRLRMSWRTIAELRSRSYPFESILLGDCDLPAAATEKPDEIHPDLAPSEYLAALDRIDVVLECTDSYDTESFLAIAGRDAGIPVVAHEDRPELTRADNALAAVWSADGFAEAIQGLSRARVKPSDPSSGLQRFMELIGAS